MGAYSDKNVVITGGGSGIGLALAKRLARGGARVVITGRTASTLEAAVAEIGTGATAYRGNVVALADLERLAGHVQEELGALDALFVNAGIAPHTPFGSTSEELFDEVFAINVKGAYFTVEKLAPLLRAGAGVVLTTSVANTMGLPDTAVYSAAKAAVRSMARTLSGELLSRGIRVNAVSPGPVDTGILETMMSAEAAAEFKAERVADNPVKRFGTPEEIAGAAAFLAFEATYSAGIELVVDGGTTQL